MTEQITEQRLNESSECGAAVSAAELLRDYWYLMPGAVRDFARVALAPLRSTGDDSSRL